MLTIYIAILCSWLATAMDQAKKQRETVDAIENAGGQVAYDYPFDQ